MQIYLPQTMVADLKRETTIENISVAEFIRKCVEKILYRKKKKKFDMMKDFVGKYRLPVTSNSVDAVNEYYDDLVWYRRIFCLKHFLGF